MINKTIHNFHFVLNSNLKNKITNLSEKLKLSKSDTVIHILDEVICVLNKYQYELQENTTTLNYQQVDWDSDMHIFISKSFYRKIRHLADTIFSFSMAIVVRKLIELYFKILEKSNGRIERVKKVFKRFYNLNLKKFDNTKKQWNKEIKDEQLSGEFYYFLRFNDKFAVTGFKFDDF